MSLVGNLADLPLTDIFQIVSLSKRTGVLNIATSEDKASITFLNGNVIKASSTRNKMTLGSVLKAKGLMTDKDERMVIEAQRTTRAPFGSILVHKHIISREQMEANLRGYIQTIILELLGWEEGHFQFELLSAPSEVLPPNGAELILEQGIETQHLIIEGLRLLDEEKHRKQQKDQKMKAIGFSSLMEKTPVSLVEAGPAAPPQDNTGHPDGLWESIQDEIGMDKAEVSGAGAAAGKKEQEELSFLEQLMSEVGEDLEPERTDGETSDGLSSLKSMVEELKGESSLSEVLLLILRYAGEFLNRAALFVVREREIRGFGQFGLPGEDNAANDRIRNVLIPSESDSFLASAIRARYKVQGSLNENKSWDRYLSGNLGGEAPEESVVLPLVSNNRVIALLYGDNGLHGSPIGDIGALEIFIIQAGFVLDRSLLESRLQDMQGH